MTRARVRRRRSGVVVVALLVTLAAPAVSRAVVTERRPASTRYVVRPGDTLWSIASQHVPDQDPRAVVDAIARTNGVDPGTLAPGQELQLPE